MKIAVITGASSGLGIEFLRAAVTLYPEIDTYWLIARREDRLEALKPQFPEKIFQHLCAFRLEQSGVYFWCPVIGQCEQLFH